LFLKKNIYSGSPRDDKDHTLGLHSAPEIRDVFGDFDDEEEEDMTYAVQQDNEQDSNVSFRYQ
jgi:RNA polymerase-associated protein LEO1